MEVESECRSPLLCADGDGNDESVPCSQSSSAPQTQQLLEQFDRSVKFADENVSPEAYHSKTDVRPATSLSEVQDSSTRDEGSTRQGTADGLEEGDGTRPQTNASHSSQKKSFKPKKTFDFDNGDTALSEIDSKGNMDGHCDYKFYTGATFSGKMRHGERNGAALLVKHTGERWEINYRHNKIKGAATLLCPNGDRVSGTFVTPSWDGDIVCQFGDGSRFDGAWDYPRPLVPHTGTLVFSEGSLYTGEFIGRHPHGAGNLVMANGRMSAAPACNCRVSVSVVKQTAGSYSIQPVVGTRGSIDDSSTEENAESAHVAQTDLPVQDSAAGIFLFNSFIRGAVARALKSPDDMVVLPSAFAKFFTAFWGHQQLLVEDGVLLPGHVTKFLPFLDPASVAAVQRCGRMWALAFDGGASAACAAAAATMAKAPFCGRYIDEVGVHAQNLYASAVKELEACTKDPHLFFPGMKDVCDNATVNLPVLPPPSILDREAFSAAVAAAAAILMQGVRDCDAEGACRMGRESGEWPWRYGGNWIQDCRHGVGAYSDASGQLFVGVWDRDVPVTGAGFMHRQPGSSAPGGIETMMCGAVHPPVPPQVLPPVPVVDRATMATTSADATAVLNVSPSPQLPASSLKSPVLHSSVSAAVIKMLHPSHWLPSEISLLHLGSGWIGHGGSIQKLSPPHETFSLPLRTSCARVPPACQLAAPLSWSPLEDERLAAEAARAAERKAAEDADAAKQSIDAERRAAAKKRLQLAGSKVVKGMGRDDEPNTSDHQRQHLNPVDCALDDLEAASFADHSHSDSAGTSQDFADAGGWLSVAEVGSFAFEGGWYCGTVADGMRHGRGIMLCDSGSSYSGEWCNDVMHGFGQMLLASGSSLSGCWWKGRVHGFCRHMSRRDGSTYEGSMVHGERRGRGKLTFAWADVYEGELAGDLPNGNGIMHTSAGDTLRGVFKDCEPSGPGDGIKVLPDGRRFTGPLLDGRPHGQGTVEKDESQVWCTFDEGVFMCYNAKH